MLALCLQSICAWADEPSGEANREKSVQAYGQKLLLNPPPEVTSLSLNEARGIFPMRVRTWPDGSAVTVFVLPSDTQLHTNFVKQQLRLLPHQLKRNWDRMVYTGIGQAPIEVATEREMLARLKATPGSIGYTSTEVSSEQLLILQVR